MTKSTPKPAPASTGEANAPFTLDDITAGPQVVGGPQVTRPILSVPVRKPGKQMYFRTHPSPDYRNVVMSLHLEEEREVYLFRPEIAEALNTPEIKPVELVTYIDNRSNVFLWPLPVPPEFGSMNPWHESQRECADRAKDVWLRMVANMSLGLYDTWEAKYKDPVWPELTMLQLVTMAFAKTNRFVGSVDHPVVRKLFPDLAG